MGPHHLYMHEKLADEHRQELLHEMERRRLMAHVPHQSSIGRHTIARLGAFLIAVGMWLERIDQHEADLTSVRNAARSLSGTLH